MTYAGLENVDHDGLSFTMERTSDYTDLRVYGNGNTLYTNCTMTAPYLTVSSSKDSGAFSVPSTTSSLSGRTASDKKFFIAANGLVGCGSWTNGAEANSGSLLMKETVSTQNNYYVAFNYSGPMNVTYNVVGDQTNPATAWTEGGAIAYAKIRDSAKAPFNTTTFCAWGSFCADTTPQQAIGGVNSSYADYVFGISEKAGEGQSYASSDKFIFGANTTLGSAKFNVDDAASGYNTGLKKDYIKYIASGPKGSNSTYKANLVSERGSIFSAIGDDYVNFNMASTLAHAQFMLTSSEEVSTDPDVITKIMGEGDSYTTNGVKITVKSIDEKVGACSVGTGSTPSCTVDTAGQSAVIMGDGVDAAGVTEFKAMAPFGEVGSLVVMDKDAVDTDTVIAVGGPMVNTVTKSVLEGSSVDFTATPKVVKEVVAGKKIVVAGYTAADTLNAAKDFVAALKRV